MMTPRLPTLAWCHLAVMMAYLQRDGGVMNQHGHRIKAHWTAFRPEAYAQMENPDEFFAQAGEEAATTIAELSRQLEGQDLPGEDYLEKVARLNNARAAATAIAYDQSGLMSTETSREEWEGDTTETDSNLLAWAWAMQAQLEGLEQTSLTFEEAAQEYLLPIPYLQAMVAATSPAAFLDSPEGQTEWTASVERRWQRHLSNS